MTWQTLADGTTIGGEGTENGTILRDEEFRECARITLEKDGKNAPYTITCNVYDWMFHTRHFCSLLQAADEYDQMKGALSNMLAPSTNRLYISAQHASFAAAIEAFVSLFP